MHFDFNWPCDGVRNSRICSINILTICGFCFCILMVILAPIVDAKYSLEFISYCDIQIEVALILA